MITDKEYKERRSKITAELEDFSVLVLFSGVAKIETADEEYSFSVNRNFYYLTGVDQEGSMLIIVKSPIETKEYLFIPPFDESKEKWYGKRIKDFEARNISGIENVLFSNQFDAKLDLIITSSKQLSKNLSIYLDLEKELKVSEGTTTHEVADVIKDEYEIEPKDAYPLIIRKRMIKSHDEIKEIKEAIRITHCGLNAVLNKLEPNIREYQLKGIFEYTLRDVANSDTSFTSICASGKNATILHYPKPLDVTHENDLMLFDVGAKNNYYCGDISRTYPVSGTFSLIQASLYNLVLAANKHIIEMIRPGILIKDLQEETIRILTSGLLELKLIDKPEEYIKYYFHGVSHHLGLDTHDPSDRTIPLEPGNIITVEPGLYIKELGIGIRIEDDVLVTNNGSIVLSVDIPKEIDEIEKLMETR